MTQAEQFSAALAMRLQCACIALASMRGKDIPRQDGEEGIHLLLMTPPVPQAACFAWDVMMLHAPTTVCRLTNTLDFEDGSKAILVSDPHQRASGWWLNKDQRDDAIMGINPTTLCDTIMFPVSLPLAWVYGAIPTADKVHRDKWYDYWQANAEAFINNDDAQITAYGEEPIDIVVDEEDGTITGAWVPTRLWISSADIAVSPDDTP